MLCELRSDDLPFAVIAKRLNSRFRHARTEDACIGRWWVMEREADHALLKAQTAMQLREERRRAIVEVPARFYVPEKPWASKRPPPSDDPRKVKDRERTRLYKLRKKAAKAQQAQEAALSVAMDPKPSKMVIPQPRSRHYSVSWT